MCCVKWYSWNLIHLNLDSVSRFLDYEAEKLWFSADARR